MVERYFSQNKLWGIAIDFAYAVYLFFRFDPFFQNALDRAEPNLPKKKVSSMSEFSSSFSSLKPTLHFICGKIASGKTTWARKIASDAGAIFICEDEWLANLYADDIKNFEDYIKYTNRMKTLLSSHVGQLLNQGVSVVFDFAGNTPNHRKWVRSIFESVGADHKLHLLDVSDVECKRRLAQRNIDKPEGLYWGVSPTEADYDLITKYFSKPSDDEGFNLVTQF